MPPQFQSLFKQLGTQLQPFGPPRKPKAPTVTPPAQGKAPTGYGTATGLYGPAGGMPASVGTVPEYGQSAKSLFEVSPLYTAPVPKLSGAERIAGWDPVAALIPKNISVGDPQSAIVRGIQSKIDSGVMDMQAGVDELVAFGIITQAQADTTLNDYNASLSQYTQQSAQAQEAFDVQRGVQRRNILQRARLGEQDLFQYGRGDLFDQAVEAAYRGL